MKSLSPSFVSWLNPLNIRRACTLPQFCSWRISPKMCDSALDQQKVQTTTSSDRKQRYCQHCAGRMELKTPPGDERVRSVCTKCRKVEYQNPKVVVGSVPLSIDKKRVLLAKRAIPPIGTWTIPAGFLELEEDPESGAVREAWEECRAELGKSRRLLAVYSIMRANQIQLVYQSTVLNEESISPGVESLSVKMFAWDEIPWEELSFPTVRWVLEHMQQNLQSELILPQLRIKNFDGSFSEG